MLSLTRADLADSGEAWFARRYLLRTARKAAELGACCGFGGALLCLALFGRQDRRQTRRPGPEPASPQRPGTPEGSASPRTTAVSAPQPAGARDSGRGTGQSGARPTERRKRDYGRWI